MTGCPSDRDRVRQALLVCRVPPDSPVPAPQHRHLAFLAQAQDGLNLLDPLRQGSRQGQASIGGKPVAFVGSRVFRLVQQGLGGQDAAQFPEQVLFACCGCLVPAFAAVVVRLHGVYFLFQRPFPV